MSYFTACLNTDYMILNGLDDQSWLNFALTCKKHYHIATTEQYFKSRLFSQYDKKIILLKPESITYKQQYVDITELLYIKGGSHWIQRPDLMVLIMTKYDVVNHKFINGHLLKQMSPMTFEFYCEHFNQDANMALSDYKCQMALFLSDNILLQNHCLEKYFVTNNQIELGVNSLYELCKHDNLDRLKSMVQIGYKLGIQALHIAIRYGHRHIMDWMIEVGHFKLGSDELFVAARYNQPEIYDALVEKYSLKPKNFLSELSDLQPEIVLLLTQKYRFKPGPDNMDSVVIWGHVPAVKLLMEEHRLVPSQNSIDLAFKEDHFGVLVYLYEKYGLKPNTRSFEITTQNINRLQWYLREYNITPTQAMVSSRLSLEILKYFYDEYSLLPKINDPDISCLNFESVQWFVKHGIDLTLLVNCFARAGDLKSYRFLRGL